jgi:hypothetical protein
MPTCFWTWWKLPSVLGTFVCLLVGSLSPSYKGLETRERKVKGVMALKRGLGTVAITSIRVVRARTIAGETNWWVKQAVLGADAREDSF